MSISTLIDKQDNFEIIRDEIGAILAAEVASQKALATAAGKDPLEWNLQVFTERSNPWEFWLNDASNPSPITNVWYDNSSFDLSASNSIERQKTVGTFNIDCYGLGQSADDVSGGHTPGDQDAAFEVQRAVRLVRNILMAADYTYLGLRGLVWRRWFQSVTVFQPPLDGRTVQQVVGSRLSLSVEFSEFSPQIPLETLELLAVDVERTEDGLLIFEADYEYPL